MVVDTKLYDILGVEPTADSQTIKKAYKRLAVKLHPDKGGNEEKFKELNAAFNVLSDEESRRVYDQTGSVPKDRDLGNIHDEEMLQEILESLGFMMGGMGGFPGFFHGRHGGKPRTPDVLQDIHVTLDQLYHGKKKNISITKTVVCKSCAGEGGKNVTKCSPCRGRGSIVIVHQNGPFIQQIQQPCDHCRGSGKSFSKEDMCGTCKGTGHHEQKKTIEIMVPPGTPSGYMLMLKGESDERVGHETGDMRLRVLQKPHDRFTREGNDLSTKVTIDLVTALIGGAICFEHLDGQQVTINLPKGKVIQHGEVLLVQGRGMPILNTTSFGNLKVIFDVKMPSNNWAKKVSDSAVKKLLREN
jgi:DnaJ homolog subfamily A member 2